MIQRMARLALLSLIVTVASVSCVTEDADPTADLALAAEPAGAEVTPGGCNGEVTDLTDPAIADALRDQTLVAVGDATVDHAGDVRSSRAQFVTKGGHGPGANARVTIECTSSCRGSMCSNNGCDASASGCSSLNCFGSGCTGTCTKKSTYTPDLTEETLDPGH